MVETHDGHFIGDCGLTVQDVEGTPHSRSATTLGGRDRRGNRRRARASPAARRRPHLGMEVERTAYVHGGDALVFGKTLQQAT